jgi:hypothetical protein
MAATSFKETTMNGNHLFARAAIAVALVVTLPAYAQVLGGGMRGGLTNMQGATFGGGFGTVHGAAGGKADASVHSRADRIAEAAPHEAKRDAGHAVADASIAGRRTAGAAESAASKTSNTARGTAGAAAGSAPAISTTGAAQGEAQSRNLDAAGSGRSALSLSGKPNTSAPPRSSSKGDSGSPAPKATATRPSHGGDTPRGATEGKADASASAAVNASATG